MALAIPCIAYFHLSATGDLGLLLSRRSARPRLVLVVSGVRLLYRSLSPARNCLEGSQRPGRFWLFLVLRFGLCRMLVVVARAHYFFYSPVVCFCVLLTRFTETDSPGCFCGSLGTQRRRILHDALSSLAGLSGIFLAVCFCRPVYPRQTLSLL